MKNILELRLINQKLTGSTFKKPAEVVEYMGAMQAQEYAMAKWAIGLRLPGSTESIIEKAFNKGEILRTHLLRPTWHFVTPKDIRWMLEVSSPRIQKANGFMRRKLGLNDKLLKKSINIFIKALEGGKHLTRRALQETLTKNKIVCEGHHLSHIMMYAELEGIICSGTREEKQFTYALLEERVPLQKKLKRTEALSELSKRYFRSRGPATLPDFTAWSNLTVTDAKEGMASLGKNLSKESFNGRDYYLMPGPSFESTKRLRSFLMPNYDEYGMAYKDRSAIFDAAKHKAVVSRGNPVFNRTIILEGRIEGKWQRSFKKNKIIIETFPFEKLGPSKQRDLKEAIDNFEMFVANNPD